MAILGLGDLYIYIWKNSFLVGTRFPSLLREWDHSVIVYGFSISIFIFIFYFKFIISSAWNFDYQLNFILMPISGWRYQLECGFRFRIGWKHNSRCQGCFDCHSEISSRLVASNSKYRSYNYGLYSNHKNLITLRFIVIFLFIFFQSHGRSSVRT